MTTQQIDGFYFCRNTQSIVVTFPYNARAVYVHKEEIKRFVCNEGKDTITVPMPEGFNPVTITFSEFFDNEFEFVGKEILQAIINQ